MRRTIDEFAEELSINRDAADGLIKFLLAVKLAKFRGERQGPGIRGKGPHVYDIEVGAAKEVARLIRTLEG
jgi:hypothetical protein